MHNASNHDVFYKLFTDNNRFYFPVKSWKGKIRRNSFIDINIDTILAIKPNETNSNSCINDNNCSNDNYAITLDQLSKTKFTIELTEYIPKWRNKHAELANNNENSCFNNNFNDNKQYYNATFEQSKHYRKIEIRCFLSELLMANLMNIDNNDNNNGNANITTGISTIPATGAAGVCSINNNHHLKYHCTDNQLQNTSCIGNMANNSINNHHANYIINKLINNTVANNSSKTMPTITGTVADNYNNYQRIHNLIENEETIAGHYYHHHNNNNNSTICKPQNIKYSLTSTANALMINDNDGVNGQFTTAKQPGLILNSSLSSSLLGDKKIVQNNSQAEQPQQQQSQPRQPISLIISFLSIFNLIWLFSYFINPIVKRFKYLFFHNCSANNFIYNDQMQCTGNSNGNFIGGDEGKINYYNQNCNNGHRNYHYGYNNYQTNCHCCNNAN